MRLIIAFRERGIERVQRFRALTLRLTVLAARAGASRGELAAKLAKHGVAFFPNAFSKEECELLLQQFVDNCEVNEVRGMKSETLSSATVGIDP